MDKVASAVSGWYATRLEMAILRGGKTSNEHIIKFCKNEIMPIYEEAVNNTAGRMLNKFKRKVKELTFESEEDIRGYLEIMR